MTIAWFSPMPPSPSGIAAYSAELLPLLEARGIRIDTFTADTARDFVWKQRRRPYDLTVVHMGNAACHDSMWSYLFRYPGLVVLHDAQLHQARALWLTKRWQPRREDYLAEFRANHPDAPADVGELVAAGLGGTLYHHWPLIRLVVERAKLTIVHNRRLMEELQERYPAARFAHIEMGVADVALRTPHSAPRTPHSALRTPHSIVIAAFGGVTREKRIPQLIRAVSALADRHPSLHLLLVGSSAEHYDVVGDARRWGIEDRVHVAGYVPDAELPAYLLTADICACLRWPTNRETSASWLRCLAAGRATIITDLAHLGDVPTLDPRGWRVMDTARRDSHDAREPIAVSIDILDEEHSLQLALERLASDAALRRRLGDAARAWWAEHHQLTAMADAYRHVIAQAIALPVPTGTLPPHLLNDGTDRGRAIAADFGLVDHLHDILSS